MPGNVKQQVKEVRHRVVWYAPQSKEQWTIWGTSYRQTVFCSLSLPGSPGAKAV